MGSITKVPVVVGSAPYSTCLSYGISELQVSSKLLFHEVERAFVPLDEFTANYSSFISGTGMGKHSISPLGIQGQILLSGEWGPQGRT